VLKAATDAAIAAASSGGTTTLHLFDALLVESSGFARRVLLRCVDGSIDGLITSTKQAVAALPKQTPAPTEAAPNMALIKLLQSAQMASKSAGDSVTSISHLLMACLNDVSDESVENLHKKLNCMRTGIHQKASESKFYSKQ